MKRGFTLIELLVVISIISMLASLILASVQTARAKGRDAARYEEIHQIDLAIQLYASNHGNAAPTLGNSCVVGSGTIAQSYVQNCIAISSAAANTPAGAAWANLKSDISSYMPSVPSDPCGSNCTVNGTTLGFTYVAPAAMKYFCNQAPPCNFSDSQLSQSYQIYAPLETQTTKTGTASFGSFFTAPPSGSGWGS